MLLSVCTLIVTLICKVLADHEGYNANVGTVLFTTNDKRKDRWSKAEVALLQARKHFQSILPPPGFIKNFNEGYIQELLQYFKHAYARIKKDALDAETDIILTTALSDAVGGYLKVWVLPLAKLDFYAGSISQEHVVELFKFHNSIKDYLGTEGDGWRSPSDVMLNSVPINVVPRAISNTRNAKASCDHIAFFEKTLDGLNIPLPNVNWDERVSTMFVPLKNLSLIPIILPDKSNTLLRYYDAATNCIAESNPTQSNKFEEKFQGWLNSDIIPHLKDDNLYLALASVLTLTKKERNLYNNIMHPCSNDYHVFTRTYLPLEITSKKMLVLCLILVIEMAWFLPTLIYLLCVKKKKGGSSNVFIDQFIEPKEKRSKKSNKMSLFRKQNHKNIQIVAGFPTVSDDETRHPNTLLQRTAADVSCISIRAPLVSCNEIEAQCLSYTVTTGTGSRCYINSQNNFSEAIVTDICNIPKKSSLKALPDSQTRIKSTARILPLSSQEKLHRIDTSDKTIVKEVSRSPDKNIMTNKDSVMKSVLSQSRQDCLKFTKTMLPKKHIEIYKRVKSLQQKPTEKNRELKIELNKNNIYDPTYQIQAVKIISNCEALKKVKSDGEVTKKIESPMTVTSLNISETTESNITEVENPSYIQCATSRPHPYTDCQQTSSNVKQEITKKILNTVAQLPENMAMIAEVIPEDRQMAKKSTHFQIVKESKCKKAAFKVSDSGKPLFEITIDRPGTELFVGVSNAHRKHQKHSKIPKPRSNIPELILSSSSIQRTSTVSTQVEKKSVDDTELAGASCESDKSDDKLNDTI